MRVINFSNNNNNNVVYVCISCQHDVVYVNDIGPSDRHEMDREQTARPKTAISSDVNNRSLHNNFQSNRQRL